MKALKEHHVVKRLPSFKIRVVLQRKVVGNFYPSNDGENGVWLQVDTMDQMVYFYSALLYFGKWLTFKFFSIILEG